MGLTRQETVEQARKEKSMKWKAGDAYLEARGEDTFLIIAHNISAALPCTSGEICSNLEKNKVTLNSELLDLFSGETNKFLKLVVEMKAIQEAITTGTISPKTDREILVEVTKSTNRVHIAGVGTKLAGTGNLDSGRSQPTQVLYPGAIRRPEKATCIRWKKRSKEKHLKVNKTP
ncbi:hypothetical protein Tco_1011383 [Tanacetum coccineum]